jgi:hypothetical protein
VQAAKRELLSDACPKSYDGSEAAEDECEESDWSYAEVDDENNGAGKEFNFDGQSVEVEIRWLEPADTTTETRDEEHTPVTKDKIPEGRSYFEIESAGNSENGDARRKVEAIYYTESLLSIPRTYFALRDITIGGNATRINNASIFAGGDIKDLRKNTLQGDDEAYEFWDRPPWNTTARDFKETGVGAVGEITYKSGAGGNAAAARAARYEKYDFDGLSDPEFIEKDPPSSEQDEGEMSYPFNPGTINDDLTDFLCETADQQGNYREVSGTNFTVPNTGPNAYPDSSDQTTVYCVEFTGDMGSVTFKSKDREGTMVVVNGDLLPNNSANGFKGIMLVDDPDLTDDEVPLYSNGGSFDLTGYASVEGDMEIFGNANPFGSDDVANRPGFYSVEQWSWRECYSEDCN